MVVDRTGRSPARAPLAPRPAATTQAIAPRAPVRSPSPPQVASRSPKPPEVFQETQDLAETTELTATAPTVVTGRLAGDAREEVWSIVRAALDEAHRPDMFRKDTNERLAKIEAQLTKLQSDIERLARTGVKAPSVAPPPFATPVAPPVALAPLPLPTFVKSVSPDTPAAPAVALPPAPAADAKPGASSPPPPMRPSAPPPAAPAAPPSPSVVTAPAVSRAPVSRAPSIADWEAAAGTVDLAELGFDGTKRRKRLGVFIGILLVALVGGSVVVAFASQMGPR